jgi:serine phosphatase RsbU (regulator of sigma subunit)
VTAFIGLLSGAEGRLRYVSAGHGPVVFYEGATDSFRELSVQGVPLGLMDDFPYEAPGLIEFAPGDVLTVVTDGVFEWANLAGASLRDRPHPGPGPMRPGPAGGRDHPPPAPGRARLRRRKPQLDDLTVVVIKKL